MKVVHLAPFVEPGYTGGMQRYVTELVREQRCAGLDASVYTVRIGGEPLPPAPSVASLLGKRPSTGRGRTFDSHSGGVPVTGRRASIVWQRTPVHPMLVSDLRNVEADVVHLHSPSPTLEMALLLAHARRGWKASATGDRKLVVTVHNDLPRTTHMQRALGRIEQSILVRVLRRAAAVIMPHEAFAAEIAPRFGLSDQRSGSSHPLSVNGEGAGGGVSPRLHIVPPGVDHSRFRDLRLERDPDTVLFVGHVRPEKGLHVLVEAMALLPRQRLEVVAAVSYESKYYESVKRRAFSLLGDRVRFRENVAPDGLNEAYNRAGVVVAPSLGLESWNLVLLEAASTGAACVRTDLPGMRWADFAVEAAAGDVASLASAIEDAITRRQELGCWGKQRAHEYSWERTCRETLAAYVAA